VTNFGAIDDAGGVAVQFMSSSDRLIDEAGSTFTGAVMGGGGTLELATGSGSIAEGATSFSGFGAYVVDAGGDWTLAGAGTVSAAASMIVAGYLLTIDAITGGSGGAGSGSSNAGNGLVGVALVGAGGTLANGGAIGGGAGGNGSGRDLAGIGGVGIDLATGGATVNNSGTVSGGVGGGGGFYYNGFNTGQAGNGGAGSAGVDAQVSSSIVNSGLIRGGAGGAGGLQTEGTEVDQGASGGVGAAGLVMALGGKITNAGGVILGGAGGAATGTAAPVPVNGVGGGAGVSLLAGGTLVNSAGSIVGGQGSAGALSGYKGGGGGSGGAGLSAYGAASVDNAALVRGAAGGTGGYGRYFGGGGGSGGTGARLMAGGSLTNAGGTIAGGVGGAGGACYFNAAGGGAGGDGVDLGALATVINSGQIAGGQGGAGATSLKVNGGSGGAGGVGVSFASIGTVMNTGQIVGGAGGAGGPNGEFSSNAGPLAAAGRAGNGVDLAAGGVVSNGSSTATTALISGAIGVYAGAGGTVTVTNYGTITGTTGVSVQFKSASDELVVEANAVFVGTIQGGGGTLALGGDIGTMRNVGAGGSFTSGASGSFTGFGTYDLTPTGGAYVNGVSVLDADQRLIVSAYMTAAGVMGGAGSMTVTAGGVIGANYVTPFRLDLGSIVNDGSIEAHGPGGIVISGAVANQGLITASTKSSVTFEAGSVVDNEGGTIQSAGGAVALDGAEIQGGVLAATGGGGFRAQGGGNVLDGAGGEAVTLSGRLSLLDGASLTLDGSILDEGEIAVLGGAEPTDLIVGAGGATLAGGGAVVMSDSGQNRILAAAGGAVTLTNDDRIYGAGSISDSNLTLVNGAGGLIEADDAAPLVISTGANTVQNAGVLESDGTGGLVVRNAIDNTGRLIADGGDLTVDGAVGGTGGAWIADGVLSFRSTFSQNVTFAGKYGELVLGRSQSFAGAIAGFSKTGATALDLEDIEFDGSTKTSYAGTATSGILTVTDGRHTAHIELLGDYLGSTFTVSTDGHGGTLVVDPASTPAAAAPAQAHGFVAVMASFGAATGGSSAASEGVHATTPVLAAPRMTAAA